MFEPLFAFKYLIPKKNHLSTALISLLSMFVISMVVWLVVVFLSVTNGIERNWLKKLTSLNAPLRICPTNAYYSSYYYLVDGISASANYTHKTINEKLTSHVSDPFQIDVDMTPPPFWPRPKLDEKGRLLDPVKQLYATLEKIPNIAFQDFEISGAMLRLSLTHQSAGNPNGKPSFLTQMSFLSSLTEKNPNLETLIIKPRDADINNILKQLSDDPKNVANFLENVDFRKVKTDKIPLRALCGNNSWPVVKSGNTIVLKEKRSEEEIVFLNKKPFLKTRNGKLSPIDEELLVYLPNPIIFNAFWIKNSTSLRISGSFNGKEIVGDTPIFLVELVDCKANTIVTKNQVNTPPWIYTSKNYVLPKINDRQGILLPKSLQDNGVVIGDSGYLSYATNSLTSNQEQRIRIFVAGFYDPGVLPTGARALIVPQEITSTINSSTITFAPDGMPTNGIYVWGDDSSIKGIQNQITKELKAAKIDEFWEVKNYREFEFSKELMQQFQSDRTLFTLIAIIIIVVACSNVISLLVLLVNDKKREIATLQALGASRLQIASIFGLCGVLTGICSTCLGVLAAILTLNKLNLIVNFLSLIQGHAVFSASFFGETLPNTLSFDATLFVIILTPIISLLAGIIPAIKAARLSPSPILRSE